MHGGSSAAFCVIAMLLGSAGCGGFDPPPVVDEYDSIPARPIPFTAATNRVPEEFAVEEFPEGESEEPARQSGEGRAVTLTPRSKSAKATANPRPPANPPTCELRTDARLAEFVGVWEGKWDNQWRVRYEFAMAPDGMSVVGSYAYEEKRGEPLRGTSARGLLTNGFLRVNRGMDIKLSVADPKLALVVGRWANHTRTAVLRKQ